jgi:hypothetical protein
LANIGHRINRYGFFTHSEQPLAFDHHENWYEVNLWREIVDFLFMLETRSLEVAR